MILISSNFRACFLPMSELSNVKQLNSYINQVFPGGALFLVASDNEFRRLFMELASTVLQSAECRKLSVARMVGKNGSRGNTEWISSVQVYTSQLTVTCFNLNITTSCGWSGHPPHQSSTHCLHALSQHHLIMVKPCCRCAMPCKLSCQRTLFQFSQ